MNLIEKEENFITESNNDAKKINFDVHEKIKKNKNTNETSLQKMRGILFWKHNPENNERYLKKELTARCGEAINGKKLSVPW